MNDTTNILTDLQGITGIQGLRGAQGTQGFSGVNGLQGVQGYQGGVGIQGLRGCDGLQGAPGRNGAIGVQGFTGRSGAQGLRGIQGLTGIQGVQGIQGATGPLGYMGYVGAPGEVGIQGLQGAKGHIWIDGISLDGYNTRLYHLLDNKFVNVSNTKLTVNNGAKISIWLNQESYNYLLANNCYITLDNYDYMTVASVDTFEVSEVTSPIYYAGTTLLTDVINNSKDLNTVVELTYYNNTWYYSGGLIGNTESNDNPDQPVQPEVITYTAGNGINIDSNNVINVKIAGIDNNSLQLTENGELYVPQVEIPEAVNYTPGNGININENNEISVKLNDIVSESENNILTIDENGKLSVSQQEIPESIEYEAGQGIEISDDNLINVKISTSEGNSLIIDENGLFVPQVEIPEIPEQIEYTAGQGLNINENNEIGLKISQSENNSLTIDENGDLFVPQVEIPEQEPISCIQNFITKDLTDIDEVTYWGLDEELNLIQVEDGMAIEPGHKYLVIITTDGNMYWVENDDKDTDTYVTGFNLLLNENNEQILRISLNNNTVYDIPTSNFIIPVEEQYKVISLDQDSEYVKVNITKNDEDKQYELKTSIKTVSLTNLPDDENGLVTAQDIKQYIMWYVEKAIRDIHPNADVVYSEVEDKLVIVNPDSTDGENEGTIGTKDIKAIENYIDNANMGTY